MGKLPPDDFSWYTMDVAVDLRRQQTGSVMRAVKDLEQVMASRSLYCMRRHRDSGEYRHVPTSFWKRHVIDFSLGFVQIYRRTEIDSTPQRWGILSHQAANRFDGNWLFYVWQPDFDRLYLGSTEIDPTKEPHRPIDRAEAVLCALYHTKAEMPRSLKAATAAVNKECSARGWQPVSSPDTVHRAAVKLGYRAPRKSRPSRKRKSRSARKRK